MANVDVNKLSHGMRRRDMYFKKKGIKTKTRLPWEEDSPAVEKPAQGPDANEEDSELDLDDLWNDLDQDQTPAAKTPAVSSKRSSSRKPRSALKGSRDSLSTPQSLRFDDSVGDGEDDDGGLAAGDVDDGTDDDIEDGMDAEMEPAEPLNDLEDAPNDIEAEELPEEDVKHKPERKRKTSRRTRRQTLKIVQTAKDSGLADEWKEQSGVRRSTRRKIAPTKWWEGYTREIERKPNGIGAVMSTLKTPTAKRSKHFVNLDEIEMEKREKRKAAGKSRGRKRKKKVEEDEEEEDEDDEDPDFDSKAWVRTANGGQTTAHIAKLKSMISMNALEDPDAKLPPSKLPKAGKWFTTELFSSGQLILPPGSCKSLEVSVSTEIFFVAAAAPKSLEVSVEGTKFILSKGSTFYVPTDNDYEIKNLSKKKEVRLLFVLVSNQEKKSTKKGKKSGKK
mmetsp:Transcript_12893/g.31606  ORF Transcript_12893/g.31606 Transcript_12893/m.31606 type:complete len:448 (-) Transcript_12893:205-1548(-)